ncbi:DUF6705 family protein [Flavobacterium litorale]|uniref:DUF6705 domain-containing protein n=1 Tax=Flavobacterium litorale TaxID=2856519 RepID=A0ABX8V3E4_9FLAO|nr:hypothetical protein [Flavobacterium litorale]QYJ67368.1 hypothetical protein K1I41_07260 [Flavobacterium litorale]
MKNIYKIYLIITFLLCNSNVVMAQFVPINPSTPSSPYEGTWHYQDGNELFIVSLWKEDSGDFRGHYKKVEYNNGTIGATILNSRKVYNDGFVFPPVIYGDFNSATGVSGVICDNTLDNNLYDCKDGRLQIQINSNCTNCPVTAIWKIEEVPGLRIEGFISGFSIPTDVVLTKVSDEIDLD